MNEAGERLISIVSTYKAKKAAHDGRWKHKRPSGAEHAVYNREISALCDLQTQIFRAAMDFEAAAAPPISGDDGPRAA